MIAVLAPTRSPSLAEQWMVEDALEALAAMPPEHRVEVERMILLFGPTPAQAFSEIYRQSRTLRIRRALAGETAAARRTSDGTALEALLLIGGMINLAAGMFRVGPLSLLSFKTEAVSHA